MAEFQAKFVQISEQNSRLTEYEDKIALLSQEIERLNVVLKNNLHEKNDIAARYNKLEFELESLRSAANRQTAQLDEAYQSKLSAMTQEIERREREKREF
ncbi:MAG: hypothetical protein JST59_02875 [Actinobacteria bacterium]|nr:hypothetical protein [Actinomycetota bacterium]